MPSLLIVDATGRAAEKVERAFRNEGWAVRTTAKPSMQEAGRDVDAILLVAGPGELGQLLPGARSLRGERDIPLLLATSLDRSGWDRTFSSPEALEVDALFDLPLDPQAVLRRLKGIFAARKSVSWRESVPAMEAIIERAVSNEEAAEQFYRRAAAAVSRDDTREALLSLADEEREHKRLLQEFKAGVRALPKETVDRGLLIEELASPPITEDMSPADAFLLAARKEKVAVEFYESWAGLYPPGPERDLLRSLAEVERRHQARVSSLFTNAAFPEAW